MLIKTRFLVNFIFLLSISAELTFSTPQYGTAADQSTLELLHIVFRHGARTPGDTYPNDPHLNETYSPIGRGHLTNKGKLEAFNMGMWLRQRYGNLLGSRYEPDLLHAQATWVHRTVMTLQTVLASLFPTLNTTMKWRTDYDWQPIPVFAREIHEDNLLLQRTFCPRYHEALAEVMASREVQAEIAPYLQMMAELAKLSGKNISKPRDVQSLYFTLLGEQEWGLQLPPWTREYFPEKMQFLTEQNFNYDVYTRELQKLKAGHFLKKMFTEMSQRRLGTLKPDKRKLFIYTAHDTTMVAILSALNVWARQFPKYLMTAIFELHRSKLDGEFYVEIYFRNDATGPVERLTVPGCGRQCTLDRFIELARDVVLKQDDEHFCMAKNIK